MMLNGSLLAMLGEFRSTAAIKGFDCFVTHPHLVLLFLFNFRVNVFYISFFPVPNGTGGSTVNQSERDFRPLFPFVNSSFYRSGRSKDLQVTPGQLRSQQCIAWPKLRQGAWRCPFLLQGGFHSKWRVYSCNSAASSRTVDMMWCFLMWFQNNWLSMTKVLRR